MSEASREIIERVKVLREIEEISGETLARELGFDPVEYGQWEAGEGLSHRPPGGDCRPL